MVTLASLALAAGVCLLIFTGTVGLLRLSDVRAARTIRETTPTPVGSWRSGTGRVAGHVITGDGPAGPQVGPVSGQRCAWYHVTLIRRPSRSWSETVRSDLLLDLVSPGPPAIGDGSGWVLLDPRLLEAPSPQEPFVTETTTLVHRRDSPVAFPACVSPLETRDVRAGETLTLREVRLPFAREIYVLGLPVGRPTTFAPNVQGVTVCTTDDREQVLAKRRESIAVARQISRVCGLTGLLLTAGSVAFLMYAL